jgi:hypothetical protein
MPSAPGSRAELAAEPSRERSTSCYFQLTPGKADNFWQQIGTPAPWLASSRAQLRDRLTQASSGFVMSLAVYCLRHNSRIMKTLVRFFQIPVKWLLSW